jgi:predicted nucleotidyltransferase
MSEQERPIAELQHVIEALQEVLGDNLVALVLFGSRARGDAAPESDWDLLLIARQLPERPFARHLFMQKSLPIDWRGRVSLLAKTVEEFESAVPPLFLDIALDGVILYDPDNYAAARISYLQRLLQAKGLVRQQHGREFAWRWQDFPGLDWRIAWEETT